MLHLLQKLIDEFDGRFRSSNSIQIDRIWFTKEMWDRVRAVLDSTIEGVPSKSLKDSFDEVVASLPEGAQINIRDSMSKDQSLSWTMFRWGWAMAPRGIHPRELWTALDGNPEVDPSVKDALDAARACAETADEQQDAYVVDSGATCIDWDEDPKNQLSIILKKDGTVAYAAYYHGQQSWGNAKGPKFMAALLQFAGSKNEVHS